MKHFLLSKRYRGYHAPFWFINRQFTAPILTAAATRIVHENSRRLATETKETVTGKNLLSSFGFSTG
jgi:hypothetical protein